MRQFRDPVRPAQAIRTHILGANALDPNTVYTELRDWYYGQASLAERTTIDSIRIGMSPGWHGGR